MEIMANPASPKRPRDSNDGAASSGQAALSDAGAPDAADVLASQLARERAIRDAGARVIHGAAGVTRDVVRVRDQEAQAAVVAQQALQVQARAE